MALADEWDAVLLDLFFLRQVQAGYSQGAETDSPRLPVLVLTTLSEEQYARRAFKAGAAGYVTKDSSRAELAKAIHTVMEGGKYLSQALAEKLIVDLERGRSPAG
jgi:two-component system invasion response regulator UvrY